jgi:hypothetical protein
LTLACVVAAGGALADVRVYKARHRVADELLPLAETALAGSGSAVVDHGTNSLVLMGPPGAIAEALGVLEAQDRALRTVVLHYASRERRELEREGVQVEWQAGGGSLRIGNVIDPAAGSHVTAQAGSADERRELALDGVVRILEGQSGRITTGAARPFAVHDASGTSTEWVSADSGFEASVRILGDGRVRVELEPQQARFEPDGEVAHAGGAFSLELAPGRTLAVGGLATASQEERREPLSGAEHRRKDAELLLLLRAEIE